MTRTAEARAGGVPAHILDLQNIARHDLGRVDLEESTVTEHHGLERERLLELVDDGAGLELLHETDDGVEEQQRADDTKVDPVLESGGEKSSSLIVGEGMPMVSERSLAVWDAISTLVMCW